MQGGPTTLIECMTGNKRFITPVYQRNYCWTKEDCEQLYDDLIYVSRHQKPSHFLGSIVKVHQPQGGALDEYLIIDGQQRMTTVSILLVAMYNLIKEHVVTPDDHNLAQVICQYIINSNRRKDNKLKLQLFDIDQNAYQQLFQNEDDIQSDSNITSNYLYFYNKIRQRRNTISIDQLFDAISKLNVIMIELERDDDPQLVFESLNATGKQLTEGDKIRNYVLIGQDAAQQSDIYDTYWLPIEQNAATVLDEFLRHYLSIKLTKTPTKNNIYHPFKSYIMEQRDANRVSMTSLLREIKTYSEYYSQLISPSTQDNELNACIKRLNYLKSTVTRPFFMEVFRMQAEQQLSSSDVLQIFLLTEIYIFRREMCNIRTNSYNTFFASLHRTIEKLDNSQPYIERFKFVLLNKSFPSDADFRRNLSERVFYGRKSSNKYTIYVLERLENRNREQIAIYDNIDNYQIEHIMPQTLSPQWRRSLGNDANEIHNIWVGKLANLTLTAYNPLLSNKPFIEKRDMPKGYRESTLHLNRWIAEQNTWDVSTMERRERHLIDEALKIWPLPTTTYRRL